jgi:hypothetical protein
VRGFFALAPVALALLVTFPNLNEVYQAFVDGEEAPLVLMSALPSVWLAAAGAGLYGVLWGVADRRWELASGVTRILGALALACGIAVLVFGLAAASEQAGNPVSWAEQKWEAFKNDDAAGQEQSRYLAASGSGRYTLWQVAWEDFASRPLLGVGTHNYEATYYQLREKEVGYIRQPHILPLEVLAERGLIGGVLFFGFLATCLGTGLWQRFKNLGSEGKAQVGAMVAAVTYWFVHSSAEWFWQLPAVTLPATIYLAMLVGSWQRREVEPPRWPSGWSPPARPCSRSRPLLRSTLRIATRSRAARARHWRRWSERNGLTHLARSYASAKPRSRSGRRLGPGREALQDAVQLNPDHYVQYEALAQLHELRGRHGRRPPARTIREAVALKPLDPT